MSESDKNVVAVANEKKYLAFLQYENGRLTAMCERQQKDIEYKTLRIKDLLGELVVLHQRLGDAELVFFVVCLYIQAYK